MKHTYLAALLTVSVLGCNTGQSTKQATAAQDSSANNAIDNAVIDTDTIPAFTASTEDCIEQITSKTAAIKKALPGLSPEEAAASYTSLKSLIDSLTGPITNNEGQWLDKYINYYDDNGVIHVPADIQKRIDLLATAGIEPRYVGEGYTELWSTPYLYVKIFKPYLPADYKEFIQLTADEDTTLFDADAGIIIPWNEVGQRVEHWERFLQRYPSSPLFAEAKDKYDHYLHCYLFGEDNTPTFEKGVLEENVAAEFNAFMARNPNGPSTHVIKKLLELSNDKTNNDNLREAIDKEIEAIKWK